MKQALAVVTAIAYLLTAAVPASARHEDADIVPTTTVATGGLGPDSIDDPCQASGRFLNFHMTIAQLDSEALEAQNVVLRLHKTSRWHPYKEVENEWADMKDRALPTLAEVARVPAALGSSPDSESKQAALDLTSAYQNDLEQLVDYMHSAVYYERTESAMARPPTAAFKLTYSRPSSNTFASMDITARQLLDAKSAQLGDILRSLKLPEYRYWKLCGASGQPFSVGSISNACDLAGEFLDLHATVKRLGDEAISTATNTARLHRSRLSRPYKTIETQWTDVHTIAEPTLDKLSDLPIELDQIPDDQNKQDALDLVAAYQNAVEKVVDYTHFAVYEERVQNQSAYGYGPFLMALSFGAYASTTNTKINMRGLSAYTSNQAHFMGSDALQALFLPEHRYGKACHVAALSPPLMQTPNDLCALSGNLLDMHATILQLGAKAHDAGRSAERLHHTSRSRAYKYVNREFRDIWSLAGSALETLSVLPVALDDEPDNLKKQEALDLVASYQDAVEHIADYTSAAQFLAETEDSLSWVFYFGSRGGWFNKSPWFDSAGTSTSTGVSVGTRVDAGSSGALSTGMTVGGSSGSNWFSSGYGVDSPGPQPWQKPTVLPLTFGLVPDQSRTRSATNNLANSQFESKSTELPDALRSLKLPEYRFARTCHVVFPARLASNQ